MYPHDDDDDRPALRPVQAPRTPRPLPEADVAPAAVADPEPRLDEGAGRPVQAPAALSRITPEDWERIRQEQAREAEQERQRLEEELAANEALFNLPGYVASPLVAAGLLAVLALLGIFVVSQVTSTLAAVSTLPAAVQYLSWALLAFFVALVLWAVGRFLRFYLGLRPNQPVKLPSLMALSQRTQLRRLVQEKKEEARGRLETYLREYPLGDARARKLLHSLGIGEEQVRRLGEVRTELEDGNRFAGTDQWLSDFRDRFQAILDEAARGRITYYARRVAIMTAASPNTLIDTLLTGYCSFSMLADLCQLYNLRVSRLGTGVLLVRVFFNAYLAGQLNELEGVTETGIEGILGSSGVHFGSVAMDASVGKVVGKVGARAASGALNYFMLRRLGLYAARLLRPVHVD
jgi:uncharacterized membrane protein YcjF (UPF0283 family)